MGDDAGGDDKRTRNSMLGYAIAIPIGIALGVGLRSVALGCVSVLVLAPAFTYALGRLGDRGRGVVGAEGE